MNQWTRYLTIVILLLQGPAYITNLHAQLPPEAFLVQGFGFNIFATIVLMAGTMFVMWLRERLTDRGIGNGISLIIMVGIIARLPFALFAESLGGFSEEGGGQTCDNTDHNDKGDTVAGTPFGKPLAEPHHGKRSRHHPNG